MNLSGLHLIKYQLGVAHQFLGLTTPLTIVCEVVAPKKTLIRELSCDLYQENNLLPARAVESFIATVEASNDWQHASKQNGAFEACKKLLIEKVRWGEDYVGPNDPEALIARLKEAAMKRHRQHVANIHRSYGREIGLVSKRGTVKLRYAPTDALLKTLLFANVDKRIELDQLLEKLHQRYGLVFGAKEGKKSSKKQNLIKKLFRLIPGGWSSGSAV